MSVERSEAGRLNAAIANEIGKLIADFTGAEPTNRVLSLDQDVVVCLLEDGATRSEVNLAAAGKDELSNACSADGIDLVAVIEPLTGRTVGTFLSGSSTLGESSV